MVGLNDELIQPHVHTSIGGGKCILHLGTTWHKWLAQSTCLHTETTAHNTPLIAKPGTTGVKECHSTLQFSLL